jgi:hypothetical protein
LDVRASLRWVEPEIWRLLRVPHDIKLSRLHDVLQVVFGWEDAHLHQFHIVADDGSVTGYVGTPSRDLPFGLPADDDTEPARDERRCLLSEFLAKPGDRIGYEYDFGDSWLVSLDLAAVHQEGQRPTRAVCLDGARAGPPDDSGGPPGYADMLAALADPKHPDHEHFREWVGKSFDPAAFDAAKINRRLARMKV